MAKKTLGGTTNSFERGGSFPGVERPSISLYSGTRKADSTNNKSPLPSMQCKPGKSKRTERRRDSVAALCNLKRQLSAFLPRARPESGGYHPMALHEGRSSCAKYHFPCTCIVLPALILMIAINSTSYYWSSYAGCAADYCTLKKSTPRALSVSFRALSEQGWGRSTSEPRYSHLPVPSSSGPASVQAAPTWSVS